jgi:hypothetical protein
MKNLKRIGLPENFAKKNSEDVRKKKEDKKKYAEEKNWKSRILRNW